MFVCFVRVIQSQSYNAIVFYFDNISFSSACFKSIISPKRMFSQSSILPYNGFNNLFPTVEEANHFMEVRWLKKMKSMVMCQYPTCIWCIIKDELISEISFGILYIFKR